ncbi:hypothetical protein [Nostoc sp.]
MLSAEWEISLLYSELGTQNSELFCPMPNALLEKYILLTELKP